jgi:hypothetical protein
MSGGHGGSGAGPHGGGGGRGVINSGPGIDGYQWGGGGGGAINGASQVGRIGGMGASGVVVVTEYIQTEAAGGVPITGGTMTGPLTLPGPPTAANHATTKSFVEAFGWPAPGNYFQPVLAAGWSYTGGAGFMQTLDGRFVMGRASVTRDGAQLAAGSANQVWATLPAGWLPGRWARFAVAVPGNPFTARMQINATTGEGTLSVPAALATGAYFHLDGILYDTQP